MTPELSQILLFGLQTFLFQAFGFVFWLKKQLRSKAVNTNAPCATYLKMKFETAKLYDAKVTPSSDSRFVGIRNHMR